MNVLHLVAGRLDRGAARGAYWLHRALVEIGVDSTILTNSRDDLGDDTVISANRSVFSRASFGLRYKASRLPIEAYRHRQAVAFSTGLDGIDMTRHPAYGAADLVHLHWINSLVSVRSLGKVAKPVVWTLRDMWPFTGGCHHAMDCERYTDECGRCPQLDSHRERDLSRFVLRHKQASVPANLRVVGISRWISERASRSALFRQCDISTISNNVDTELFHPIDRQTARQALGLDDERKLVLIGALDISSIYKGFDLFLQALDELRGENVRIVTFGRSGSAVPESLGFPVTELGLLADAVSLRLAYSAADVFVAPSRAEAFGKTLAEAMACGTPVVCFDATGPKDIVEHEQDGYKAAPFEPADLARGIRWVLGQDNEGYVRLCRKARERAVRLFDSRVIARQYETIYREMLGCTAAVGAAGPEAA
jgi:glycosyltransferase involved in cell wall biosynthesis